MSGISDASRACLEHTYDQLDNEITKLEAERTVTNVRLAALDLELRNLKARRDAIAKDIKT